MEVVKKLDLLSTLKKTVGSCEAVNYMALGGFICREQWKLLALLRREPASRGGAGHRG